MSTDLEFSPAAVIGYARARRAPAWADTWLVLLCSLAFALPAVARAQDIQLVQVPVVKDNYIHFFRLPWPSTRFFVTKVLQDNLGFLWLAGADGLQRYDAYGFMRVPASEDPGGRAYIIASSAMKDRSGRIWFGLDDSLDQYDPATGKLKVYKSHEGDTCRIAIVHQISEGRDGLFWLATDDGIAALDPVTSQATCYQPRYNDDPSIGERRVISMLVARDNTLWMTTSSGLYTFDLRTRKVLQYFRLETKYGKFRSTAYPAMPFQDGTGTIWVGLASGGDLASISGATGRVTVYSFQGTGLSGTTSSGVVSIQEDDDGALWLGTNRLGLVKLTPDRKRALLYQSNPDIVESLSGDLVVGVYKDREGSFWATTTTGDVYRFEPHGSVFRSYRHQPGDSHSLDDDFVTAAYAGDPKTLWVGTDRGLNRVNRSTGKVTRYEEPVFSRGVNAITGDSRGDLWIGTGGNGLVRFDPGSGRYRIYSHIPSDPRTLSFDTVGALWVNQHGELWVATDYGLDRFDAASEEFHTYTPKQQSLTQYHCIAEESDGHLWLATATHGLQRFDPRTGAFTIFEHTPGDRRSLSDDRVNSVYIDHSGTLWAATFRGLSKFDSRDGTFTSYDSRSGLPADSAIGILEDASGHLWISTTNGLSRYEPRTGIFTNYHTSDGLLTDLFSGATSAGRGRGVVATKGPDGEMLFGSYVGLVAFFPNQVIEHTFEPSVVLSNFRLFGKPAPLGTGALKEPSWSALELPAGSIFSLDFSALSYIDPARTLYRYRLEGLEKNWNETGSTRRTATYTTLPPGNYTFRVQARTERSGWSPGGATIRIRVLPPWYATAWFRLMAVCALCAIAWALYRLRLRQLAREFNRRFEERVKERMRVARELHDTLLQGFYGVLLQFASVQRMLPTDVAQAQRTLEGAIAEARRAVNDGRDAVQGLRGSETDDAEEFDQAISAFGKGLANNPAYGSTARLTMTVEGSPRKLNPAVRDEIYRIVTEALRNAYRYAEADCIEVQIIYGPDWFALRVSDDGKGIDSELLSGKLLPGHFGLRGMQERAQEMGAKLIMRSAVGSGTEMELSVPGAIAYASASDAHAWFGRHFRAPNAPRRAPFG